MCDSHKTIHAIFAFLGQISGVTGTQMYILRNENML